MEMISLNEKVNFFENTVTNYQRANVGTNEEIVPLVSTQMTFKYNI